MRYYIQYNENNKLIAIGIGAGGIEITKKEYETFLSEVREKASLVNKLYNEEITLADVPIEWQEEIQRRVDERIEQQGALEEQPISSEEFYQMVEEVL